MVIGLGFTAMLAESSQTQPCQLHLLAFLHCGDNFTQCIDKFERLSKTAAEVICSAINPFKLLGTPRYFDDFLLAITNVVYPASMELIEKKQKTKELLQTLFEECN